MIDDGLCQVRPDLWSITIQVSDINYQAARLDEKRNISGMYGEILNAVDPTVHVQLTVLNRNMDPLQFQRTMTLPDGGPEDPWTPYREELNQLLADKALQGQNSILREKYFTLTAEAPDYLAAKAALGRLEGEFTSHFKDLGCNVMVLSGLQRLELVQRYTRPGSSFLFDYDQLLEYGQTTKDAVAPMSLDFSPHRYYRVDGQYGQVLVLRDLPARLTDELITRVTDLPFELTVTVHIDRMDPDKALKHIHQQIAFMEMEQITQQAKAYQKGYDPSLATPGEQRRGLAGARRLLSELEDNDQRMFKMTLLIHTAADSQEELNDRVLQICGVCALKSCQPEPLRDRQREGFNSTLPLGHNSVDIRRTMHTRSLAMFIPFTTQELYQPGGIYYGLNTMSRNLIFLSRYSLQAPSGWVLGKPGSGKSMAVKAEMIHVLLSDPNAEVIVIDPEREYQPLCGAFDGACIRVSAGSSHHLNPMDVTEDYADEDDPMLLKTEFILSLVDIVCGGGLGPGERSVVSRACAKCYGPYFSHGGHRDPPTLKDFYKILHDQPEPEAKSMALALELYIDGALDVFAHQTNVEVNNRFVVYDVKDLGKQLRTLGMLIVLDQIWNRITRNRAQRRRTWLYIDEIQLLFSSEVCSEYFFQLWGRARKWGAIPTGITQNVENLLVSEQARTMLSNSDFVMMLNQAQPDRIELAGLLNISNRQLSSITNAEPGHGLLVAGKAIVPFANDFPRDTQLYKLMTTKPGEEGQA